MVGSFQGLQTAKYNLEKHYAVVGIVGDLDLSLKVMEAYLPRSLNNRSVQGCNLLIFLSCL